jgi:hypothetical protein
MISEDRIFDQSAVRACAGREGDTEAAVAAVANLFELLGRLTRGALDRRPRE